MDGEDRFVEGMMSANAMSIDSQMAVKDAAGMMGGAQIGCVEVTDRRPPVGIIVARDLVQRMMVKCLPYDTVVPA